MKAERRNEVHRKRTSNAGVMQIQRGAQADIRRDRATRDDYYAAPIARETASGVYAAAVLQKLDLRGRELRALAYVRIG